MIKNIDLRNIRKAIAANPARQSCTFLFFLMIFLFFLSAQPADALSVQDFGNSISNFLSVKIKIPHPGFVKIPPGGDNVSLMLLIAVFAMLFSLIYVAIINLPLFKNSDGAPRKGAAITFSAAASLVLLFATGIVEYLSKLVGSLAALTALTLFVLAIILVWWHSVSAYHSSKAVAMGSARAASDSRRKLADAQKDELAARHELGLAQRHRPTGAAGETGGAAVSRTPSGRVPSGTAPGSSGLPPRGPTVPGGPGGSGGGGASGGMPPRRPPGALPPPTIIPPHPGDPPTPPAGPPPGILPGGPKPPRKPFPKKPIPDARVIFVDLSPDFNGVRSQDSLGACAAFSITSIFEYIMHRGFGHPKKVLSPLFLYYVARKLRGNAHHDSGLHAAEAPIALINDGVCFEELWSFEGSTSNKFRTPPAEAAVIDALSKKAITFYSLDKNNPDQWVYELLAKNPIDIGVYAPPEWHAGYNKKFYDNFSPARGRGHAMVIVGYHSHFPFNGTGVKAFKIRNSWGHTWGENGYTWVPAETLQKIFVDDPIVLSGWKKGSGKPKKPGKPGSENVKPGGPGSENVNPVEHDKKPLQPLPDKQPLPGKKPEDKKPKSPGAGEAGEQDRSKEAEKIAKQKVREKIKEIKGIIRNGERSLMEEERMMKQLLVDLKRGKFSSVLDHDKISGMRGMTARAAEITELLRAKITGLEAILPHGTRLNHGELKKRFESIEKISQIMMNFDKNTLAMLALFRDAKSDDERKQFVKKFGKSINDKITLISAIGREVMKNLKHLSNVEKLLVQDFQDFKPA